MKDRIIFSIVAQAKFNSLSQKQISLHCNFGTGILTEIFERFLIISFIYVGQEIWTNFATEHINLLDVMFIEITFLA
jgi:hypothetical protein